MRTIHLSALVLHIAAVSAALADPTVTLTLPKDLQEGPYTGRVYFILSADSDNPRGDMENWFHPPSVYAIEVKDAAPGAPIDLSHPTFNFPDDFGKLAAGTYTVQGLARRNRDYFVPGQGAGDLYSKPQHVTWPPKEPLTLTLDQQVKERKTRDGEKIKYFTMKSKLLSDFHGREITMRAGVAVPAGWSADSKETWPAVYFITGFGGDHRTVGMFAQGDSESAMRRVLTIVPDPTNYWGHSVFADSANTGPWGRALTEELIPAIEKQFHGPAGAAGATGQQAMERRFVAGISSGGWSSLWLQVEYPDTFGGCWSHSPDPVDFRDFQRINLYSQGVNMYTDEHGKPRPIARDGDTPTLFYKPFVAMETAMGPGGQIGSFEAVFSPRGANGLPRPLFDRVTGAVDPETAKAWEPYDITLKLKREWKTLSPKLVGKLHVYGGSADNFFLDGAVEKLAATLKELDPDNAIKSEVKIIPGMPHTIHFPAQGELYKAAAKTSPPVAKKEPAKEPVKEPALVK